MMNEHKKGVKAMKYTKKPQNLVAKNAAVTTTSSAGAHYQGKDQKKSAKHGETKHKQKEVAEGYRVVPGIDREKYTERPGLEGPFHTKSGKVVYYDKQEGKYYDPDSDYYISHDDWQAMNENDEYDDEAGMAHGSLHTLKRAVDGLMNTIDDNDNLPEWCQEKISIAEDYLVTVWDYLQSEKAQRNAYTESFDSELPYEQSLLQKLDEAVKRI